MSWVIEVEEVADEPTAENEVYLYECDLWSDVVNLLSQFDGCAVEYRII